MRIHKQERDTGTGPPGGRQARRTGSKRAQNESQERLNCTAQIKFLGIFIISYAIRLNAPTKSQSADEVGNKAGKTDYNINLYFFSL